MIRLILILLTLLLPIAAQTRKAPRSESRSEVRRAPQLPEETEAEKKLRWAREEEALRESLRAMLIDPARRHPQEYKLSKTQRRSAVRSAFVRQNPCPSTGRRSGACPGWVVDHVKPLKRGGLDHPANMQWQTIEEAKAKDRVE